MKRLRHGRISSGGVSGNRFYLRTGRPKLLLQLQSAAHRRTLAQRDVVAAVTRGRTKRAVNRAFARLVSACSVSISGTSQDIDRRQRHVCYRQLETQPSGVGGSTASAPLRVVVRRREGAEATRSWPGAASGVSRADAPEGRTDGRTESARRQQPQPQR